MDDFLGFISLSAISYVPEGYAKCDGALLQINQNQALYALLGTQFGGNGTTTFGLPDLHLATPLPGLTYVICTNGIFPGRP
jgi:microcystin-dependent protein